MNSKVSLPKCQICGEPIPPHVRDCVGCQEPVGYPNVRAAEGNSERNALAGRLRHARTSARVGGYLQEFFAFGKAVSKSRAVMTRSLDALDALVSRDEILLSTYYKMVRADIRIPQDNAWDKGRTAADSTINPNYHDQIHFAALSIDGAGVEHYGEYHLVLKDVMVSKRTTVFEENPFLFCDHKGIIAGALAPPGYRATWADRHLLAQAKLHQKLKSGMPESNFPGVLLEPGVNPISDFIEAHIYGVLHRTAIECVRGPVPKDRDDKVLWKRIKRRLADIGATVIET